MKPCKEPKLIKLPDHSLENLTGILEDKVLLHKLSALPPFEIAELVANQPEKDQLPIFNALPQNIAEQTFPFFSITIQKKLLRSMTPAQASAILKELPPDDRTNFLQELPNEAINELIKLLPKKERILTLALLGYPEGSVGRLMTPDYIAVQMDWTVEKVLDHIQAYGHDSETIDVIFVVDEEHKLLDDIKLKHFLFVPRQSSVASVANHKFVALSAYDSDEEAINVFKEHDRNALPVIDKKGVLLGIVTIDDILRLANREATEDMQKIGGMEALDEPYMQAPFMELIRKRAGWLVLLFIGEMFTATALGYFEKEIAKAVVLALFLPLIISSGGNAGSQASTLVIRAMALGEVKMRDWWKICRREALSGLALGIILGLIGFFRISIWRLFTTLYGPYWLMIAITIGISLIGVVLWGTLIGALLPLILKRLGADPAKASAPLVATIVDVSGIIIYFLIAILILSDTLL